MDYQQDIAAPDTSYQSFNDQVQLQEPPSPPRINSEQNLQDVALEERSSSSDTAPSPLSKMQRKDSGYESYTNSPRSSGTYHRPPVPKRISNTSTTKKPTSFPPRAPRARRPSTHRSSTSYSQPTTTTLYLMRSAASHPEPTSHHPRTSSISHVPLQGTSHSVPTFFQFPPPRTTTTTTTTSSSTASTTPPSTSPDQITVQTPATPPLPQTTHYWTSDRTRRLEYAAIDAAGRGVKGWMRRHLVPECFAPKAHRHLSFDDDSGSVRRYRLELEEDGESCVNLGLEKGGVKGGERKWYRF